MHTRHAAWKTGRGPKDAPGYYVVRNRGGGYWYSVDGDTWTNASGDPIEGMEFVATRIMLHGGPRDGEIIA